MTAAGAENHLLAFIFTTRQCPAGIQKEERQERTYNNRNLINIMRTITIEISNSLDLNDKEARMVFASKLYEMGKLSLGQAAELAGYSKRTFMELLADYGVSIFNYSPDELDQDLKNAQDYSL